MTKTDLARILAEYSIARYRVVEEPGSICVYIRAGGAKRYCVQEAIRLNAVIGVEYGVEELPWWRCLLKRKQWKRRWS